MDSHHVAERSQIAFLKCIIGEQQGCLTAGG